MPIERQQRRQLLASHMMNAALLMPIAAGGMQRTDAVAWLAPTPMTAGLQPDGGGTTELTRRTQAPTMLHPRTWSLTESSRDGQEVLWP